MAWSANATNGQLHAVSNHVIAYWGTQVAWRRPITAIRLYEAADDAVCVFTADATLKAQPVLMTWFKPLLTGMRLRWYSNGDFPLGMGPPGAGGGGVTGSLASPKGRGNNHPYTWQRCRT